MLSPTLPEPAAWTHPVPGVLNSCAWERRVSAGSAPYTTHTLWGVMVSMACAMHRWWHGANRTQGRSQAQGLL